MGAWSVRLRLFWVRCTQLALLVCLLAMSIVSSDFGKVDFYTHSIGGFKLLYMIFLTLAVRSAGLIFVLIKAGGKEKPPAVQQGIVFESILFLVLLGFAWYSL